VSAAIGGGIVTSLSPVVWAALIGGPFAVALLWALIWGRRR